mgnify:CR=1 FL=1
MIEKFKTNAEVIENGDKYLYGNHVRMPLSIERGEGAYVFDKDGNKYLDFIGGIAVNGLGHCHPAIVKCLEERAHTILHCSNYFYNEPAVQTAKLIVENSCFDKVLFANSGAEANEGQIKLARKYAKDHGHPERFVVITMKNSFHGRTLATCTATGQYAVHRYFEPLPSGFRYAEFNNLQSVKDIMDEYVCAILTEPVQGEGGVLPLDRDYVKRRMPTCAEKDWLLLVDEVQTGVGRTGSLFAFQHYGILPDVCSFAKGIAGGLPMSGIMTNEKCRGVFTPGTHATTFGANPVCAAAGLAVQEALSDEFLQQVQEKGAYLREQIEALNLPCFGQTRGLGLMVGITVQEGWTNKDIAARLIENGLLVLTAGPGMRLLPPLAITKEEMDQGVAIMKKTLGA